ncbi:hypothetical protein HHI36_008546 [Cryptolaemus montrouzieri]|uniref:Cactus n=1 Tax=Cryptolaemus montrouzieri TaxID=559131 RepID=A0ABD2MSR1_9CUCU
MSGKATNMSTPIPENTEKHFDDDKLFEPSRTDSGFISSGNLIISEEIIDEPEDQSSDNKTRDFHREDKDRMLVDSGVVCISENLSNVSLKDSDLNDLSSKKQKPVDCDSRKVSVTSVKPNPSDIPWKIYFQQDEDGDTHLHMAIAHGVLEAAYALIRIAPHPRLLDTPNDDALTPLHLAVAMRQWRIVRWLIIAGARPGPRNLAGDSPLHLAARSGDVECCKAILYPVQSHEREQLLLSYPPQLCPTVDIEQWNYNDPP